MRGYEFLDKLELVSPEYIEAADAAPMPKGKGFAGWAAMAACLVLIAAAVIPNILNCNAPTPPDSIVPPVQDIEEDTTPDTHEPDEPIEPIEPWTAYFNEVDAGVQVDSAPLNIPGYFREELTAEQISLITPEDSTGSLEYSGFAGFDGEGTLINVRLTAKTASEGSPVVIAISENPLRDCLLLDEPVVSVCGDTSYTVYQLSFDNGTCRLQAEAKINGYNFLFTMSTDADSLDVSKESFQNILERFARYEEGKPDLSQITPTAIPEYFDKTLSFSDAQADPDFGSYMPSSVPNGFTESSIRRYKDYNSDYLYGLWTKGMSELRWQVSAYSEADEARLTTVEDTENYDLSLYPIPRAESVPEDKWEIVNNPIFNADELTLEVVCKRAYKASDSGDTSSWRMSFSVKYGDIIVKVSSKGVSPEWVYDQLVGLM